MQCHRWHHPRRRCRCFACGQLHFAALPCALSATGSCPICRTQHPPGHCVAGSGPVASHCAQCGRCHLPSVRCQCRICGSWHTAATPCGVQLPCSREVFAEAALSRQAVAAFDGGYPTDTCNHCGALFFPGEARYLQCCSQGSIVVASPVVPDALYSIITDSHVHLHIRQYNAALSMASIGYSGSALGHNGGTTNRPYVDGWGSLKISGRSYHLIGAASPATGSAPIWGQLYILDAAEATNQRMGATRCAAQLRPAVLAELHSLLQRHNPWVTEFVQVGGAEALELSWSSDDVSMRAGMVAVSAVSGQRSIIVRKQSSVLERIAPEHALYFPLAYILLFPSGGLGYSECMSRTDPVTGEALGKLQMLEWARYLMMRRSGALPLIQSCGKLSLEFWCDVWSSIECRNLDYIAGSRVQSQLRMASHRTVTDQLQADGAAGMHRIGAPIHLPASFVGSPRWYHALFHDALALPAEFHLPDLFITITFNPEWPELARMMPSGGNVHDHADVVARVFWLRFMRIMQDITGNAVFGTVLSYCYRIEWQLRGFPHAHVLLILQRRILNAADVDRFVSAEIPDPERDPVLHQLVVQLLVHGPCNVPPLTAPCIVDGECEKEFPKQLQSFTVMRTNAYPLYMRRGLFKGSVRGQPVGDEWVVPYNPYLVLRHRSHINVQVASHLILYKYVYKYCFKAPDHGAVNFNEISAFITGRILSSAEAVWRILGLPLHKEFPSVTRLVVHLPGSHQVVFDAAGGVDGALAAAAASTSTLLQWFALNQRDPAARSLLYKDIPKRYLWNQKNKVWQLRRTMHQKVGRLHGVSSHHIELFMLRRLLLVVPGAQCWEDLRTVDGRVHANFESAVRARGMLNDDNELAAAFQEIVNQQVCDRKVRRQFVLFLAFCRPVDPPSFFHRFRSAIFPPGADVDAVWAEMVAHATDFRISLSELGLMPPLHIGAALPLLEYWDPAVAAQEAAWRWNLMNEEQRAVASTIVAAIDGPRTSSSVFFLQASGGCGKSFVANYVAANVRSRERPAMCVAASAQAATVLTGGRTAHGQLKIPLAVDASSYLNLSVREKAEVAAVAVLLWDEASMVSDDVADCVNRSLQDILQRPLPFGGMPVVFIGDFRQLLPIVKQSKGEYHTIQSCSWWPQVTMLLLQRNWRADQGAWLQLLDDVGMGRVDRVEVPMSARKQHLDEVIAHVWANPAVITAQQAVLTLTLEDAAVVNSKIISALPGDALMVASVDEYIDCREPDLYPEEFVRSLHMSGVAPGMLQLKVGAAYIIMRNIDHRNGIVNGTHIICTSYTARNVTGEQPPQPLDVVLLLHHTAHRHHTVRTSCWQHCHAAAHHISHHSCYLTLAVPCHEAAIPSNSSVQLYSSSGTRHDFGFTWIVL
jgi:hypothetical protein